VILILLLEILKTICCGMSLHYVNKCVEFEQNETSFDYIH
jgi:hypothetical protein